MVENFETTTNDTPYVLEDGLENGDNREALVTTCWPLCTTDLEV